MAVAQLDDARGVLAGKLGVVRDHHHQAVARDLLEEVHHLHGRHRVKGARGLVGKKNLGIVDEGARYGHTLHLPARELGRPLIHVVRQAHVGKRLEGALAPLRARDARERECQLHVGEDGLVRDEVVALEHEANSIVAVGVPVTVAEALRGDAVHQKVAGVKVVEAAHHVEHCRLARARGAENRHKLGIAEGHANVVECDLREVSRHVLLGDVPELEHAIPVG